jgi:large conductance mechanosensitive channel
MLRGFRQFLVQGDLVTLAVAFVVGTAFKSLVTSLVSDLFTPLIAALGGAPHFSALYFTVNGSRFAYGDFVNNLISFVVVALIVYFVVVAPYTALQSRLVPAATRSCPECLSAIPPAATRCAFCTAQVTPVPAS